MSDEERQEKFSEYAVQARDFYEAGDYDAAIERLQQANMLILDDRIMFNIGTSYEKMGECVSALAYYDAALRVDNPSDGWPDKIKGKRDELAKDCDGYNPSEVTGRISINSMPQGATVKIDGETVGKTPVEVIMLSEGRHKFQIGKKNYQSITETAVLTAQADLRLDYPLEEVPSADGPDPFGDNKNDNKPLVTNPPETESKPNIPAYAMIGAGAAGLAFGGYINWFELCERDTCRFVEERAPLARDSQEFQDLTDQRQRRVVVMAASTTVGVLLVAGGVTWLVLDRKKKQKTSLMISPTFSRDGAGVGVLGRF